MGNYPKRCLPRIRIRSVADDDWHAITEIFNYFVENSPAAYPAVPVAESFFRDKHSAAPTYPFLVVERNSRVSGFAYLSPFHGAATMQCSAVLTYFLHPDCTGLGLGSQLLAQLLDAGRTLGVSNFLAHISSLNEGSIRFHVRHGFQECGRLRQVGEKNGEVFDMVWMQRIES